MSNFEFLTSKTEYELFAAACVEAEKVLTSSPAMSAVGARKALELAVKWVYSADTSISMPYKDNLQSLIHEPSFRFALDGKTWGKMPFIIKLGNLSVHTDKKVSKSDAVLSLQGLFEFVEWIDYCYGNDYQERSFDEKLIPGEKVTVDVSKIKEQESLLSEKESEIKALREKIEAMSATYTAEKGQHKEERTFTAKDLSEFKTRKRYIDVDLKLLGWDFDHDVKKEFEVQNMDGKSGQMGYADYVLFGKDGLPLAIIEAKRTSKDPNIGRQQVLLYAKSLEERYGRRPMMFTTNGFETYFWDDESYPQRKVSSIFSKNDLQKLMNRRQERKDLSTIRIDDKITDRYYQKEAIRAVCDSLVQGHRKNLLVMATGTGKTRTASSLTDVLSRGGYVTNVLFLADRTALVKQAKDDFKNYLPDMSLCNLLSNKDDKNARIIFSTYPTMLNAIDSEKTEDGQRLFSPSHFDLIIVDEAHRSIFKKYRTIFEYFDSVVVGLTATPKTDVDRNTYDFFEMEHGVPTYAYDYETAVNHDYVLVPYFNIETSTKFLEEGISYEELDEKDKERYEDDFGDDEGNMPEFVPSPTMNKFVFNEKTVDLVLQDLMENGIKVEGGDRIGKTIIFAQNKTHAEFILERFNKLYPKLKGGFAKRITCEDTYAQSVIDEFKIANKPPYIAVSVDMMDTGIDVPEVVNLVFFKKVRSKTKFWQMIGRGTRLCKDQTFVDKQDGEYTDKKRFYIFDYCGNFEYFRENKEGIEGKDTESLSEKIFSKRVRLIQNLQSVDFLGTEYQNWRSELVSTVLQQVQALNKELVAVHMQLRHVEKFEKQEAFTCISEQDYHDLSRHVAQLVTMDDKDEYAKRFDNLMYGLIIAQMEMLPGFKKAKNQVCTLMGALEQKAIIPKIKEKLSLIQTVTTDEFWAAGDILLFEKIRVELRDLIKLTVDEGTGKRPIMTSLADPILSRKEGDILDAAYDFEDYRLKVNRYIEQHKDHIAIWKLRNNVKLEFGDYQALESIFTKELGDEEDYKREFGDTPFGLLIRKIAKLEHEAAMKAFSKFINDRSLNQRQIVFVKKIVDYVEQNGYIENITELMKPPFDKPMSFVKLFDSKRQAEIVKLVNEIKENAVEVAG
ncbi:DEAD/DEAH box helicase family protein [Lachnospiraceae bacterium LCP25S3_G4]